MESLVLLHTLIMDESIIVTAVECHRGEEDGALYIGANYQPLDYSSVVRSTLKRLHNIIERKTVVAAGHTHAQKKKKATG